MINQKSSREWRNGRAVILPSYVGFGKTKDLTERKLNRSLADVGRGRISVREIKPTIFEFLRIDADTSVESRIKDRSSWLC